MKVSYPIKFLTCELMLALDASVLIMVLSFNYSFALNLNYEAFADSMVSCNSGIIIAIFLAVFYSSNESINQFRAFTKATRQAFILLLLNSVIVTVVSLFIVNTDSGLVANFMQDQQSLNLLMFPIGLGCLLGNLLLVYKLLQIHFRG